MASLSDQMAQAGYKPNSGSLADQMARAGHTPLQGQASAPKLATSGTGLPSSEPVIGNAIADTFKGGIGNIKSGFSDLFTSPAPTANQEGAQLRGANPAQLALGAVATGAKVGAHAVADLGQVIGGVVQAGTAPVSGPAAALGTAIGNKIGQAAPAAPFQKLNTLLAAHPGIAPYASDVMNMANLAFPDVAEKSAPLVDAAGTEAKNIASDIQTKMTPTPKEATPAMPNPAETAKAHDAIDTEIRNTAAKYPTVGKVLNQSEVNRKTDPISVLSSYSGGRALPTLIKGKLQVDNATQFLKTQVARLAEIKNNLVASGKTSTPLADFQTRANAIIDGQDGWSLAKKATAKADVKNITATWKQTYPNGIPNTELDALKTEHTSESTSYNSKSPFSLDAHAIVGKTARQLVEKNAGDAPIGELNKLISSHYDAINLLNSMRGKTPHGGALSKMFNNTIGEVGGLAGGMVVGHPFIGAMAGRAGAEMVNEIINNHFISNPLKRSLVNNMKGADPAVVQKALDFLNPESQTRPAIETTANTSSADFTPKSAVGQYFQKNPPSIGLATKDVTNAAYKDAITRNVSDALAKWEPPKDINEAISNPDHFQLEQLKLKDQSGHSLSDADIRQAVGLLRKQGIETAPNVTTYKQNKTTGVMQGSSSVPSVPKK